MDERRRVIRNAQEYNVTCFIDGAKLEAKVLDIGRGGVFIGTDASRPVPIGALAGIVFANDKVRVATTFLFGRVVRRQESPSRGFAVRWEKAVSAGKATELSGFLSDLLNIENPEVEQEVVGASSSGGAISRCIFRFPEPEALAGEAGQDMFDGIAAPPAADGDRLLPEGSIEVVEEPMPSAGRPAVRDQVGVGPETVQTAPSRPTPTAESASVPAKRRHATPDSVPVVSQTSDIMSCLRTLDVSDEEISAVRIASGPSSGASASGFGSRQRRPRQHSPIEIAVEPFKPVVEGIEFDVVQEVLIPCRLEGSLFAVDASVPVVVTALGQTGAIVKSRFVPIDDARPFTLVLIIGTKRGDVGLRCHGRMTLIEKGAESGFRMAFSSIEEGDSPGVLERYLKWLEFNSHSAS